MTQNVVNVNEYDAVYIVNNTQANGFLDNEINIFLGAIGFFQLEMNENEDKLQMMPYSGINECLSSETYTFIQYWIDLNGFLPQIF